jgi:hypothetical protein
VIFRQAFKEHTLRVIGLIPLRCDKYHVLLSFIQFTVIVGAKAAMQPEIINPPLELFTGIFAFSAIHMAAAPV